MARALLRAIAFAALLLAPGGGLRAQDAAGAVDVALVLAVDASSSVSHGEFGLQMDGIAAALRDPAVLRAVTAGPAGRIAVTMVQWSGLGQVRQALGWRIAGDAESLEALAVEVENTPRYFAAGGTAVGQALLFSAEMFGRLSRAAGRRVIDISGDGRITEGPPVPAARDAVVGAGIVVNGLPILSQEGDIDVYYRDQVIGGRGAFIEVATDYRAFADAMRRKLLREVRSAPLISRLERPLR